MILIRTAEDMAQALDSSLDPILKARLRCHSERLAEYDDFQPEELALFVIVQPGDTLSAIEQKACLSLVCDGQLRLEPECLERERGWLEAVMILSDDGFGLVILCRPETVTDPDLIALIALLDPESTDTDQTQSL
jgi:hypothetical protein